MDSMGFGDSNGMTAGNKYDILNSFLQKIQNFYSHQNNNNENDQEEEVEEDPIDEPEEEETSPQKQVNANYDSLEDVSDKSNEWRKQDPELVNELARSDKGLWNSENRNQEAENIAILAALEDNIWAINRPVTMYSSTYNLTLSESRLKWEILIQLVTMQIISSGLSQENQVMLESVWMTSLRKLKEFNKVNVYFLLIATCS